MLRLTYLVCVVMGLASSMPADLTKVKECNGFLDSRPVFDKREEDLQFYMQTTAKNEQDCVRMCYEKLHFCYTVMYKPRLDEPTADGVCYFGYYRPDNCPESSSATDAPNSQAESGAKVNGGGSGKIYTCISCKENPPSFVQDVDENRLGPAKLIRPVDHAAIKSQAPTIDQSSNQTAVAPIVGPGHVLYLRESKAFSYLMPKCPSHLTYSVQPTLMNRKPKIYAATNETGSLEECAHFCFRQHFCSSAFYYKDNCLLSYETSQCSTDNGLPSGYTGAILISCIDCKRSEF